MFLNLNKLFCSHLRGTGAQCYVHWNFIQTLTHPQSGEVSVGQVATGTSHNIQLRRQEIRLPRCHSVPTHISPSAHLLTLQVRRCQQLRPFLDDTNFVFQVVSLEDLQKKEYNHLYAHTLFWTWGKQLLSRSSTAESLPGVLEAWIQICSIIKS